jgi:hypothetical protein
MPQALMFVIDRRDRALFNGNGPLQVLYAMRVTLAEFALCYSLLTTAHHACMTQTSSTIG